MPRQSSGKIRVQLSCPLRYLHYRPKVFASGRSEKWPLVLFLHGSGERGNDLTRVRRHGLPKLIERGRDYPFVVISPQCPLHEEWNPAVLEGLIAKIAADPRIDRQRIYLTGLSMGGFGVWALAVRHPGRYAAVIPICGGGDPEEAAALRRLPVWAFHGAKDRVVPPRRSREMIAAIKAAGGSPKLTVYPQVGHDSWTKTYADPAIYEWLLSHRGRASRLR